MDFDDYLEPHTFWNQRSSFPEEDGRINSAVFVIDNIAFIGFGSGNWTGGPSGGVTLFKDLWKYDPNNDNWEKMTDLPGLPRTYAKGFSINEYGYIVSGINDYNDLFDFWKYNSITNSWHQLPDVPFSSIADKAFVINSKGYIINEDKELWSFDPYTNNWVQKNSIACSSSIGVCYTVLNNAYLQCNGQILKYNSSNDSWILYSTIPVETGSILTCFVIETSVYFLDDNNNLWKLSNNENLWSKSISFKGEDRSGLIGFALNNKGYIGLGRMNNGWFLEDLWEFSPL